MSEKLTPLEGQSITFLRNRDYRMVRELGSGACGKTVLLYDEQIEEYFVCKKYSPFSESLRQELYRNFVREIKLLHQLHHENVVRVFNYYLYPDQLTGFILMEYVDGVDIEDYVASHPEEMNDLFLQAITGFEYLERAGVLHRDIRPLNLLVREDGVLKIIDLGFGKEIGDSQDFDKSVSLNWWCEPPEDFKESRYDFATEVYFVGKLFEGLIKKYDIEHFHYTELLGRMCESAHSERISLFSLVGRTIRSDQFSEIDFSPGALEAYRAFADAMCQHITKIDRGAKYADDLQRIERELSETYRRFMLESTVPDAALVTRLFVQGTYYYRKEDFSVAVVKDFLELLRRCTEEQRRIVLSNLHTRLDALPRYTQPAPDFDDDIPF